jgi:hypothetical protein
MSLTKQEQHVIEAIRKLPGQFRGQLNIAYQLEAWINRSQEFEAAIWTLLDLTLDNATGVNQDIYGSIVGCARGSSGDAEYLLRIKAQILLNKSSGRPDELIRLVKQALGSGFTVHLTESFPCCFRLTVDEQIPALGDIVSNIVHHARPAGIRGVTEWQPYPDSTTFTWRTTDHANQGWRHGHWARASEGE